MRRRDICGRARLGLAHSQPHARRFPVEGPRRRTRPQLVAGVVHSHVDDTRPRTPTAVPPVLPRRALPSLSSPRTNISSSARTGSSTCCRTGPSPASSAGSTLAHRCSHHMLPHTKTLRHTHRPARLHAQRACNELVKEIKKRPGTDDTTVIVIHFERDRQRECSADKPVGAVRRSVTV